ncbi:hypothetical protein AJ85_16070 [Alkalihalobacillus alcalophilus ATCC 27647 = CGMCC 1.3604]|uniref:Uncharacterized protein n=1 Tax=Alkalihalobacillus alcalophilus ATCC 27647 = CGMCC 1.3604 TaxID=1218173 RepID=A0A4S4JYY6_ALKAL|nr:hypothetical protein [Alkalihalobacillus alcalophilus]MED1563984.1 hypothetical protein [Alkalihalobacillus alcalophilus]THG89627.1 hypothetical protein AJ85_16070 [Alkalihalobacillus alcalophilus ATCC 27647 = CGMCC 1.3604]
MPLQDQVLRNEWIAVSRSAELLNYKEYERSTTIQTLKLVGCFL